MVRVRRAIQRALARLVGHHPRRLLAPARADAGGARTVEQTMRGAQQLRRLEGHFDQVLVAVRLRRLARVARQEEEVNASERGRRLTRADDERATKMNT